VTRVSASRSGERFRCGARSCRQKPLDYDAVELHRTLDEEFNGCPASPTDSSLREESDRRVTLRCLAPLCAAMTAHPSAARPGLAQANLVWHQKDGAGREEVRPRIRPMLSRWCGARRVTAAWLVLRSTRTCGIPTRGDRAGVPRG
jgi:hypothetical protein